MEFVRGDSFSFKFKRQLQTGEIITEKPAKMYFTVKYNDENEALFQKTFENGIDFDGEYYHVKIESGDTEKLQFGEYWFDIEIIDDEKTKTLYVGKLSLTREVTFKNNEV